MNFLKKIWSYINGKKVIIASLYWEISAGVILIWFPSGLPDTWNKIYLTVGLVLTAIGLGHKVIKKVIVIS